MTKALTPAQVGQIKTESIPDFVIEVVNRLLVKHCSDGSCKLLQEEVITGIVAALEAMPDNKFANRGGSMRDLIFHERWLDFEPVYRNAGWKVGYDRPAYNETYDPFYVFTAI